MQNLYDNPDFFNPYKNMREQGKGFNDFLEQPYLRRLLPSLSGKSVLDIGCGFGHFCRYAREQGAETVVGIDSSQNMLKEAKVQTNDLHIQYECAEIENYETKSNQFDLIVSSLAFHYVENFKAATQKMYRWLKKTDVWFSQSNIRSAQQLKRLRNFIVMKAYLNKRGL